ncbi:NUDIX domain-containing protein [Brenneria izadpanahii]|uniref:NUDIX domain-containing protein n=1 Tax=Brenneria izadpanahii TaxID=2722756 RepID=A0ABX7UX61_9GAMM|nr:NUDIX domain-containing protein [Brenneria izadpanahii]QTF09162.1 NUDIX domain-containing protein [Brenneria izadpanahii]
MTNANNNAPKTLRLSAAIVVNDAGEMLLVRKRNTQAFMQPGGKIDGQETPTDALLRELHEELSLHIDESQLQHMGRYHAKAANEPDTWIDAEIFWLSLSAPIVPAAEIEEAVWIDIRKQPAGMTLAPLTEQQLIPIARERLA